MGCRVCVTCLVMSVMSPMCGCSSEIVGLGGIDEVESEQGGNHRPEGIGEREGHCVLMILMSVCLKRV